MQTAASFQYEFTQSAETEVLINESIVLKNGSSEWKKAGGKCPYRNGALHKFSKEVLFEHLGKKASNLVDDALADKSISPASGPEGSGSERYKKGFQDIVNKHFLSKLSN